MLFTLISAGVLVILLAGLIYEANKRSKQRKQKEEMERELGLEESVGTQEHECCGNCCGQHEEGHECKCHEEKKEEYFVEVEKISEEPMLFEEEPIMPIMEDLEEIVYINDGPSSSKKYHNRPDAHNMEGAIAVPRSRADEQGFVPCSKCFKH